MKNSKLLFYIILIIIVLYTVTYYSHYKLNQFKTRSLMLNRVASFQ